MRIKNWLAKFLTNIQIEFLILMFNALPLLSIHIGDLEKGLQEGEAQLMMGQMLKVLQVLIILSCTLSLTLSLSIFPHHYV